MLEQATLPVGEEASPAKYARRVMRAWWADGLWDIAMAGIFLILAGHTYMLARVSGFPSWTWPWPFATDEVHNPGQLSIFLWALGLIPVVLIYKVVAHRVVEWAKNRLFGDQVGRVRYRVWLDVDLRVYLMYVVAFAIGTATFLYISQRVAGGLHVISVPAALAPACMLSAIGLVYRLPRYGWVSGIGLVLGVGLDLLATVPASETEGPAHFFVVAPDFGNPAIPFLVWAGVLLVSGIVTAFRFKQGLAHE